MRSGISKTIIILMFFGLMASCATQSGNASSKQRISDREYAITYDWSSAYWSRHISMMVRQSAELTLEAGYQKFIMFQDTKISEKFVLIVYMFNTEQEIPFELRRYERFDASEYSEKEFVPLGLLPNAS